MLIAEWFDLDEKFHSDPTFEASQNALESRQYDSTLELVSALMSEYPAHPAAHLLKASVFEELGQYEHARRCYSEVVEMCQQHIEQFRNEDASIARTWDNVVESTADLLFSRLAQYQMMDQALFRSAASFDRENRREVCLEELEKAVAIRPRAVYLGVRLALLYQELGREQHAIQTLLKCLDADIYDASEDDWIELSSTFSQLNMRQESDAANAKAEEHRSPGGNLVL